MNVATSTIVKRRRVWWRRAAVGAVVLPVFFTGVFVYESRVRARAQELVAAIHDAGGRVDLRPPLRERLLALYRRRTVHGTTLFLGTGDDGWLERHGALRGLNIESLTVGRVALSAAGLARLVTAHSVEVLRAGGHDLNDDAIGALAGNGNLRELSLASSTLHDAQFPRLPLEQLERLDVSGTRVTAAGLRTLDRCHRLRRLDIDGSQLTRETVQTLKSLPGVDQLALCGSNVTDQHLLLLNPLTGLKEVRLWGSSVTAAGEKMLEGNLPGCVVCGR